MFIAGMVIHVAPDLAVQAAAALQSHPGVSRVAGPVSPGRLAAAVEVADEAALDTLMQAILATAGVTGASPTAIYFSDQEELPEWN